jgi:hypothetical protein
MSRCNPNPKRCGHHEDDQKKVKTYEVTYVTLPIALRLR